MKRKYTQEISSCRGCHGLKLQGTDNIKQYACVLDESKKTGWFVVNIPLDVTLDNAMKELKEMFATCEKWEEIK